MGPDSRPDRAGGQHGADSRQQRHTFIAQAAGMIEAEKTGVDCGVVTFEEILTGSGAGNSRTGPLRTLERNRLKHDLLREGWQEP